jgi:hypothetical protein
MIIKDPYNPEEDFTPEGRKRIYLMFKLFLKDTKEDNNLLEEEKINLKKEIYMEMQNYETEYDNYQNEKERFKRLFLEERIGYFSLN